MKERRTKNNKMEEMKKEGKNKCDARRNEAGEKRENK
jgi:hypothetical protein